MARTVGARTVKPQKTITIDGTKFVVISSTTVADQEKAGRPRVAQLMRDRKVKRTLGLQKPAGQVVFMADEFENGRFRVTRLGR